MQLFELCIFHFSFLSLSLQQQQKRQNDENAKNKREGRKERSKEGRKEGRKKQEKQEKQEGRKKKVLCCWFEWMRQRQNSETAQTKNPSLCVLHHGVFQVPSSKLRVASCKLQVSSVVVLLALQECRAAVLQDVVCMYDIPYIQTNILVRAMNATDILADIIIRDTRHHRIIHHCRRSMQ